MGVTGPERFHRRFLRGEPARKMNGGVPTAHAVGDFAFREDALQEPCPVPLDRADDARDFREVDAEANDVWHDQNRN